MEVSSIDPNDDPAIQKALVVLLKLPNVFILAFCHYNRESRGYNINNQIQLFPAKSTPFSLKIGAQAAQAKINTNKAWLLSSHGPRWRMTYQKLGNTERQKMMNSMDLHSIPSVHAGIMVF